MGARIERIRTAATCCCTHDGRRPSSPRVHDLRWIAAVGFVLAAVLGLYMVWKIVRTPGEL